MISDIYNWEMLFEKVVKCICKKYEPRSACARRAGWPGFMLVAVDGYSACLKTILYYGSTSLRLNGLVLPCMMHYKDTLNFILLNQLNKSFKSNPPPPQFILSTKDHCLALSSLKTNSPFFQDAAQMRWMRCAQFYAGLWADTVLISES